MPSDFAENLHKSSFDSPSDYVKETALHKALDVAQRLKNETVSNVCSVSFNICVLICIGIYVGILLCRLPVIVFL